MQKKYRMKKCTQRQHRLRKRSVQKQWPLLAYLSKKYQRSLRERSKNDHEVIPIRTNDAEKTPLWHIIHPARIKLWKLLCQAWSGSVAILRSREKRKQDGFATITSSLPSKPRTSLLQLPPPLNPLSPPTRAEDFRCVAAALDRHLQDCRELFSSTSHNRL